MEYLTPAVLTDWWEALDHHVRDEMQRHAAGPQDWLSAPVRGPHNEAALLEHRDVLQEAVGLARRPGEGVLYVFALDEFSGECAVLGRALDGDHASKMFPLGNCR